MPRVAGVDPGTISIDVCGLEDGEVWLDRALPTAAALADPQRLLSLLAGDRAPDLIAGPSGYGLPLVAAAAATDEQLRLAFLSPPGEAGGIGGLRRLARLLADSGLPVVYTPGVIHLDTVPPFRKANRVDLGTADKVAVAALGVADQCLRLACVPGDTSFLLLEVGGAFTAALAVEGGRIVDGLGGTSGPIGWRSAGAWDGEVAYLAGSVTKGHLFRGGAGELGDQAVPALADGALKAVHALRASLAAPREVLLSGRALEMPELEQRLRAGLAGVAPVRALRGFAGVAKAAAQGAAVLADGLAGGRWAGLVDALRIRAAAGSVLDHLRVISPAEAQRRLGLG